MKILRCNCKHPFQDKLYGKGKRVHTPPGTTSKGVGDYKCTVCGTLRKG